MLIKGKTPNRSKIYITHCSAKKDVSLRNLHIEIPPDKLYTSSKLIGFVNECKQKEVNWAIFSDLYGVIFPNMKIKWYEKHPNNVKQHEYVNLLDNFIESLSPYNEIWFYHNPGRFHNLYRRLVKDAINRGMQVVLFSHKAEIK